MAKVDLYKEVANYMVGELYSSESMDYIKEAILGKDVYLSGPVTGIDRSVAVHKFQFIEDTVRSLGASKIFNPMKEIPNGMDWIEAMLICLEAIKEYPTIIFLPGWEKSHGCCMEAYFAINIEFKDLILWDMAHKVLSHGHMCFLVSQAPHNSGIWECSSCNKIHHEGVGEHFEYCPRCGAEVFGRVCY